MKKNIDETICLYKPIQCWNFYCTVSWRHYLMRWSHSQSERERERAGGVNINRFTRFHAEIRIPKGKSFGMLPYSTEKRKEEEGGKQRKSYFLKKRVDQFCNTALITVHILGTYHILFWEFSSDLFKGWGKKILIPFLSSTKHMHDLKESFLLPLKHLNCLENCPWTLI